MSTNGIEKIHNVWPLIVGEFFNHEHILIKDELINFFKEYEKKLPEGNEQLRDKNYVGNYDLYQSKYNLLAENENNKILKEVFKFIAKSILTMSKKANAEELENLKNNNPKFNVKINESWFIRYNKAGFILPHMHGSCSWCCVYYVQIGKDASKKNGSTFFLRPYLGNSLKEEFGGKYLKSNTAVFNAEEGKLLVWPNFLYHGSHPYQGNKDRIIISANSTIDLL